jgi:hypothetical protein
MAHRVGPQIVKFGSPSRLLRTPQEATKNLIMGRLDLSLA